MTSYAMTQRHTYLLSVLALALCLMLSASASAQSTLFTYQGRLTDNGSPADGLYDMQFKLFDAPGVDGIQKGATITNSSVQVTAGAFTIPLDFGAAVFDGAARYLEISLRLTGSSGAYTILSPRQPVTAIPYAIRSLDATQLGGQPASGFIQNTTTQQGATNFNISGNGTAGGVLTGGAVNSATQYNIGGLRMLAASGPYNDGQTILTASNTFLGESTGLNTTPSSTINSGAGKFNSFFGANAGKANTIGSSNAFFGADAGEANTNGFSNSFFGKQAGSSNTIGFFNSFFGMSAGQSDTIGFSNSFFGVQAGSASTTGNYDTFFGFSAGITNTTGSFNTLIGMGTDVGASDLNNGTAIGANSRVDQSDSLVLGGITGVNGGTSVNVGIGTTAPQHRLDVNGVINTATQYNIAGLKMLAVSGPYNNGFQTILTASNTFLGESTGLNTTPSSTINSGAGKFNSFFGALAGKANTTGVENSFFGTLAGETNSSGSANAFFGVYAGRSNTGTSNSFFGRSSGMFNTSGSANSFFGGGAGQSNTTGSENTAVGTLADVGASNLTNATAVGARAQVDQSNSLVLGSIMGVNLATATVSVGIGTTAPSDRLHVVGDIRVGTGTTGCIKDADGTVIAGACSSDARLKHTVTSFPATLDKLVKLRPVHFYWKVNEYPERRFGRGQSYGLIAQEVEEVMPELVSTDEQGYKAVNYSKLPVLMLQAIKELKAENDALKRELDQLRQQQSQFDSLKRAICQLNPKADICR